MAHLFPLKYGLYRKDPVMGIVKLAFSFLAFEGIGSKSRFNLSASFSFNLLPPNFNNLTDLIAA